MKASGAHRPLPKAILAAYVAAMLAALVGCSSGHPVTKAGEACVSCHSDGRAAVANPDVSGAMETGLTFAIESGADEVYLCTVSVSNTDDATVVPAQMRIVPAADFASVTVSEPGLYALCVGELSAPSATVLISATENGPADATVTV